MATENCNCDKCWAERDQVRVRLGWEVLEAARLEKARQAAEARLKAFLLSPGRS